MKKFFVLWSSQAASLLGSAVVQFALAWYLTRETGSATVLATALIFTVLPSIFLSPFVGPLIDRWDRKKILIFSDLWTMGFMVLLVVLFLTDSVQIWHIYGVMVGRAIGERFQMPALGASIPMIVPEQHLVRANGLFQTLRSATQIIAPLSGAVLMETLPMQGVLSIDIITAVIAIACLLPLGIPNPARTGAAATKYLHDLVQGFRYVWSNRGLTFLLGFMAGLFFFAMPAGNLLPLLVFDYLGGDVAKLGWINAVQGMGGIAGGLLLGAWGGFRRKVYTSFAGLSIMSCCSIGMGFITHEGLYFYAVGIMFFMGLGMTIGGTPMTAIINSVVARDMQGRVLSLNGTLLTTAILLGLLVAGPVGDAIGMRWVFINAGIGWFLLMALALMSRRFMTLEDRPLAGSRAAESPTGTSP